MRNIAEKWFDGEEFTSKSVGVEIEMEGVDLPPELKHWRKEHDGSLRGHGAEYVFRQPYSYDRALDALSEMQVALSKYETTVEDSGRAGVHVHVNVRDMTVDQVNTFISLYLLFEDTLMDFCGPDRVGNLFCLRAKDAEELLFALEASMREEDYRLVARDEYRYASINCKAIHQYGSLEFRGMRSTSEMGVLVDWIDILLALKAHAVYLGSRDKIPALVQGKTPTNVGVEVFGLKLMSKLNIGLLDSSMKESFRRVLPLIHAAPVQRQAPEVPVHKANNALDRHHAALVKARDEKWRKLGVGAEGLKVGGLKVEEVALMAEDARRQRVAIDKAWQGFVEKHLDEEEEEI